MFIYSLCIYRLKDFVRVFTKISGLLLEVSKKYGLKPPPNVFVIKKTYLYYEHKV